MKHAFLLILCSSLLLDVFARGRGGGGGGGKGGGKGGSSSSGSKSSGWSWFKSSSGSSSSSSGSKTDSKSKSTQQSSHQKPVKDFSGRGWGGGSYPTQEREDPRKPNMAGKRYPYWNPNNKLMSPRYAGNFAPGAYGRGYGQGGSPFAQSVQNMGYRPSVKSQGYGKQAVVAAGTGAVAGMALGYGLGNYPRPHFNFHDPQQEYYYNQYMYQQYGSQSQQESRNTNRRTPTYGQSSPGSNQGVSGSSSSSSSSSGESPNANRPSVLLSPPPQSYDDYMERCIKRSDLLPSEPTKNQSQAQSQTVVGAPSPTAAPKDSAKPSQEVTKNGGQANGTEAKGAEKKDDHEKVFSILEIGYPSLIGQLKAGKCVELYAAYCQKEAEKQWQAYGHGVQPTAMDFFCSSVLCLIGFLLSY